MPSSTSSSERTSDATCTALALVVFALLCAASSALWKLTPAAAARLTIADAAPLPSADNYLAADDTILDHRVLYRGMFGTDAAMRRADVVFLGNSRMMFGLSEALLTRFFEARGLAYYMLGFGHGEHDRFAADLIARHDLRPRLVVVNVDRFFTDQYSDFAAAVIAESAFDARKVVFETNAAFELRHRLHRWLPQIPDLLSGRVESILYRARGNGSWRLPLPRPAGRHPFGPAAEDVQGMERPRASAAFQEALQARGARLVLTYVPAPESSRRPAENVAQRLGLPLLSPELDGLETFDASHLTEESSQRFTAAFLEELGKELDQHPLPSRP